MFYTQLLSLLQNIDLQLNALEHELVHLPEGKLIISTDRKFYKWFVSDGHSSSYIPKTERSLAEALAKKKYITCKIKELKQEKSAINMYLRHSPHIPYTTDSLFDNPSFCELIAPYFNPPSKIITEWQYRSYEHNNFHTEQLIHKSISGHIVRSKSEALIDMSLFINKIPFQYEIALSIGDTTIYPDFTIMHPVTAKLYYWEHFGLIDNPSYSKNSFSKLYLYSTAGIFPSINLITTYETANHPLTSNVIEGLIKSYFL